MTTYHESASGLMLPRDTGGSNASVATMGAMVEVLESRMRQLEIELAEQGWQRLNGEAGREFDRGALDNIVSLARVLYLKNPLIRRAIEIGKLYVWGQDLAHKTDDPQVELVIDRFWADNQATLTGQAASGLLEVELQLTGNVFMALFPNPATGQLMVRMVPMEQMRRIISSPGDLWSPWYYLRQWTETGENDNQVVTKKALYPDWRHYATGELDKSLVIDGEEIPVEAKVPICHVRVGAFPHWRWGVSEIYAAIDWVRAYKEQLEDDATRSKALARFAWKMTTGGGAASVASAKTQFGTTYGSGVAETNPPPVTGSTFIRGNTNLDMEPMRIAGSTLDPDHSRPARLMASAGLGIPDHFFDADVGNYATSSTLDRPTELRFSERRAMWRDVFTELCQFAIDVDLMASGGILRGSITDERRKVELSWPDLLERSVTERVGAVSTAAQYLPEELTARLMMQALGVEDIDAELKKLAAEQEQRAQRAADIAAQQAKAQPPGGQVPPVPAKEAEINEAKKKLDAATIARAKAAWDDAVPVKYQGLLDATVAGDEAVA